MARSETHQPDAADATPRQSASVLIADQDQRVVRLLTHHLQRGGHHVESVGSGEEAITLLEHHDAFDLVLVDLDLPGMNGVDTLRVINRHLRDRVGHVIVMSGREAMAEAITALQEGAYDVVKKNDSFDTMRQAIQHALQTQGLQAQVQHLRAQLQQEPESLRAIIGSSAGIEQVKKLVHKVAESDITVLIQGESGSGKELIARAIHLEGPLREKPYITVNCAAIPESLLESELFGHEKGAFTGATMTRQGRFAEADGGTVFLDEIGELPLALQAKLLRVLQTGEIQPLGGRTRHVKVRVLSATNRNLRDRVQEGQFREDLYYRLAVFPIDVPPLRERPEDLPLLVDHFLRRIAEQEGKAIRGVSRHAMRLLQQHSWLGNVRELENMIYRAVVLAERDELRPEDFPVLALPPGDPAGGQPPAGGERHGAPTPTGYGNGNGHGGAPALAAVPAQVVPLDELEKQAISRALTLNGGNFSKSAQQLGIGRATLYRKARKYGLMSHSTYPATAGQRAAERQRADG